MFRGLVNYVQSNWIGCLCVSNFGANFYFAFEVFQSLEKMAALRRAASQWQYSLLKFTLVQAEM